MSAADVSQLGRRRPPTFFFPSSPTLTDNVGPPRRPDTDGDVGGVTRPTDVGRRRRRQCRRVSASVVRRRRQCPSVPPTLSVQFSDTQADVGVSVRKLDRQCRRPTLADTQADTQSVTLVVSLLCYHHPILVLRICYHRTMHI